MFISIKISPSNWSAYFENPAFLNQVHASVASLSENSHHFEVFEHNSLELNTEILNYSLILLNCLLCF